jgi:hypothetical protein
MSGRFSWAAVFLAAGLFLASAASATVHELRIYTANEGKLDALNKRFRDHTLRYFIKHGMEPLGFWIPTAKPKSKNTLIYILRHQTMEAAGASWKWFDNDPGWKKAAKDSQQGGPLLAGKPKSIFMKATKFSPQFITGEKDADTVFELRIYQTNPGKLANLGARFEHHTMAFFRKHGMESVGYWHPNKIPESQNMLIYILRHRSAEAAAASWKAFNADPEWRKVARDSQKDGRFLAARPQSTYMKATDYSPTIAGDDQKGSETAAAKTEDWKQSYKPPYIDKNGTRAGGSEVVHIVSHKGKLFAFNGYWGDKMCGHQSSQVLRLDHPDAKWQVDLETTKSALKYTKGNLLHIKGNILKSVTFTTDKNGKKVNENFLFAASWSFNTNENLDQAVSVFVRDDATGKWQHKLLMDGSRFETDENGKKRKFRRTPRDVEIYRDPVTGIDKIFLLVGDPGILAGVYNAKTRQIEWEQKPEHPQDGSTFKTRPLGLTVANGRLYFAVGGQIFGRNNGPKPTWSEVYSVSGRVNTDVGGIRGLSTVKNPNGRGDSLIFIWLPRGRSAGQITRLDGTVHKPVKETTLRDLFNRQKLHGGATSVGSLGAYNNFFPLTDPRTKRTVHLFGYQQTVNIKDKSLTWHGYYGGALYGIRRHDSSYYSGAVNGIWAPFKPLLVTPRTFCLSPFPEEENVVYIGGFDSNFRECSDRAWIFKVDFATALGYD